MRSLSQALLVANFNVGFGSAILQAAVPQEASRMAPKNTAAITTILLTFFYLANLACPYLGSLTDGNCSKRKLMTLGAVFSGLGCAVMFLGHVTNSLVLFGTGLVLVGLSSACLTVLGGILVQYYGT